MAAPSISNRILLELGDGGDPETFGFPCGARTRNFTISNDFEETSVMDCDAPLDTAPITIRSLLTSDTGASIAGVVAIEYFAEWRAFADATTAKNVRVTFDETLANGGGHWIVPMFLQSFEIGAEGTSTATFTANLVGAGQRVWTDAAA